MAKNQNNYSQTLYEINTEISGKILAAIKKCLILVIIRVSPNTMIIQTS